jgi:hypothetical protein
MPGIISITGNLGADAELKTVGSDQVCNLRVGSQGRLRRPRCHDVVGRERVG